jgi:hypothetical protein
MRVRVDGSLFRGRALDLREVDLDATSLVAAIRNPDSSLVSAPSPGPVHEFVGRLEPGTAIPLRSALAAAARSRGARSRHDAAIATVQAAIDEIDVEPVAVAPARRRAAEAGSDVAARREEVARLRGRLQAQQSSGAASESAERDLREAIAALSEAETEALAADQALERAERAARAARDARDRRLSLVDERDNLHRRARAELAAAVYDRFRRAIAALPVAADAGSEPADFEGSPLAAGLAVARLARLRAPVVLVDGPFSAPVAARAALDASVVLV